ncbi:hypothetical protein AB6A23_09280 [Paenibacillus tarimensis]
MIKIKPIPQNIQITVDQEEYYLPYNLQESINNYCDSLILEKPYLTRGEIFSIKTMSLSNQELRITLQKTDYAHLSFSQHMHINEKFKCKSVVANGVMLTKDRYFIIGEMNALTSTPGRLQFVADKRSSGRRC